MGWLATVRLDVLKLAVVVPPLVVKVPWPRFVPPSEKITRPVGVLGLLLVTVAVKVTLCPHTDGFVEDTTAVVLLAFVTVWVMAVELLAAKLVSPL